MIRAYTTLNRRQRAFLSEVHELGLTTDLALSAAAAAVGELIDESAISRWRKGEGHAPLGLLPVLLGHVDQPALVLDVLARPLGLRVEAVEAPSVGLRSVDAEALGVVREAMAIVEAHKAGASAARIVTMGRSLAKEARELSDAAVASAK